MTVERPKLFTRGKGSNHMQVLVKSLLQTKIKTNLKLNSSLRGTPHGLFIMDFYKDFFPY
jgi:hypothetical protein